MQVLDDLAVAIEQHGPARLDDRATGERGRRPAGAAQTDPALGGYAARVLARRDDERIVEHEARRAQELRDRGQQARQVRAHEIVGALVRTARGAQLEQPIDDVTLVVLARRDEIDELGDRIRAALRRERAHEQAQHADALLVGELARAQRAQQVDELRRVGLAADLRARRERDRQQIAQHRTHHVPRRVARLVRVARGIEHGDRAGDRLGAIGEPRVAHRRLEHGQRGRVVGLAARDAQRRGELERRRRPLLGLLGERAREEPIESGRELLADRRHRRVEVLLEQLDLGRALNGRRPARHSYTRMPSE